MAEGIINSKETEISVLGTILYQPDTFPRIYGVLKPEDFYFPAHRYTYEIMINLHQSNLDINIKTVWNEMYKKDYSGLSESDLESFLDYRVSLDVALSFASQVSEFSGYRILQSELDALIPSVRSREKSLTEFVAEFSNIMKRVHSKGVNQTFKGGHALVDAYLQWLSRPKNTNTLTGIEKIDRHIEDFDSKEITVFAARPGMGKTAMMLQSARKNLEKGRSIGFLSMEMDASKLLNRLVSAKASIDSTILKSMSPEELSGDARLVDAIRFYGDVPMLIDDTGPFTSDTVPQKIRKMVYEYGCEIIYVDYIGLIQAGSSIGKVNRNEQLTYISGGLKGLASELDIPIVVAAQLNRESTKSITGRPTLAHLRDSGAIEQDASLVIFLYPDVEKMLMGGLSEGDVEAYMEGQERVSIKFEVAKQRNGPVFVENLFFEKVYGQFLSPEELHRSY